MFEEVPRERRGLSRWVPVRRVVIGPFVLGGGMLLAALGGSVAVAAAATVLTASAISSDVPPRPEPPVAPTSSHPAAPPIPHPTQHRPGRPATGATTAFADRSAPAPAAAPPSTSPTVPAATAPAPAGSPAASPPRLSSVPVPPTGALPSAAPSSSGPRGNAVIHLSGYDPATGRFAYQFATVLPHAGGYVISGPRTFTAVLAPSATIISGGSLCPPAGSSCTADELIAAADSGLFAEVAIDVTGALRSVLEVGDQAVKIELVPLPSISTTPAGDHRARRGTGSPHPGASPTTSS